MKTFALIAGLLVAAASQSFALQIPVQRRAIGPTGFKVSTKGTTLIDNEEIFYETIVTIAGQQFNVIIDTGSSDLFITATVQGVQSTDIGVLNITYGTGSVAGNVSFAPFSLGSYSVQSQAFINNAEYSPKGFLDPADGLVGLSFDGISDIDIHVVNATNDTSRGRTPLANIFASNPSLPNTLSILLDRTDDPEETSGGSFLIGEEAEGYEDVLKAPQLPRFTPEGFFKMWTVWMDGATVNGKYMSYGSAVKGAPRGKSLVVLDTGTTDVSVPSSIVDKLYGSLPGAFMLDNTTYVVPCLSSSNLSFTFGGQVFPVHPLDLTRVQTSVASNGTNFTFCTGSYEPSDVLPENFEGQDMLFGDAFLRNVYSSFNYGNDSIVRSSDGTLNEVVSKDPYVQLLAVTDQDTAWTEFSNVRGLTLQKLPPEPSMDLIRQYLGVDSSGGDDKSDAQIQGGAVTEDAVSISSDDGTSKLLDQVDKYSPIVIGLLAGNMFIGLVLCVIALAVCVRRGASTRSVSSSYTPVRFKDGEESQETSTLKYSD